MTHSGEHFTPAETSLFELEVNLDRYQFVLPFVEGKTIIDLGCGGGLGTYLYSLVAEKVYAIDYNAHALEETGRYPYPAGKVERINLDLENPSDLEKLALIQADVCVALEVLEHIEDPAAVLKALKTNQLVFSLPLYSLEVSSWHKYKIETEKDVRALIEPYYQIGRYEEQKHPKIGGAWMRGEGVRLKQ